MTIARLGPNAPGTIAVLLLVTVTRWPVAPNYLYYFDSANFALALEEFSPALHQPQPPGYPLFVGLTRLIHLLIENAQSVFVVTGILSSAAAVLLLWILGRRMFDPAAGLLAAALLVVNPVFWFGGVTNQVRVFLAVGGAAIALLAWRAVERRSGGLSLYAAFAATGIAAGFRPAGAMLLVPLLLWAWARTDRRSGHLLIGFCFLGVCAAGWIILTGVATGGFVYWLELLWAYSKGEFRGSSAVFGASAGAAAGMFMKAVVWNGIGVLPWIWAAPFNKDWRINASMRLRLEFLTAWFLPGFLFSAFVHIGDPDQALGTVPVLCLAGGGVLKRFVESRPARPLGWMVAAVLVLNAALFFVPPGRIAQASSYRAVRNIDRLVTSAVESIASLRDKAPLAIIHYGSLVSWRQLQYYFPEDSLFVVSPEPSEPWLFRNRKRQPIERIGEATALPKGSRVCILVSGQGWQDALTPVKGWIEHGSVIYADAIPGGLLKIGTHRFRRD